MVREPKKKKPREKKGTEITPNEGKAKPGSEGLQLLYQNFFELAGKKEKEKKELAKAKQILEKLFKKLFKQIGNEEFGKFIQTLKEVGDTLKENGAPLKDILKVFIITAQNRLKS